MIEWVLTLSRTPLTARVDKAGNTRRHLARHSIKTQVFSGNMYGRQVEMLRPAM